MEILLDLKCAEYGDKIIKEINKPKEKNKIESFITKSLGVLQEDGVYAFAIYTKSKSGNEGTEKITAKHIHNNACALLKDESIKIIYSNCSSFTESILKDLASNLDSLLLAKELLERTLVYARYHAKALDGGGK